MEVECIPFRKTGYFSSLICDYLDQKEELKSFYNHFPTPENFKKQILEKQQNYNPKHRAILVNSLHNQYKGFNVSETTRNHIEVLLEENTFTVTTGHQLNLFTGPIYFLYKIVSTINLTIKLKEEHPDFNFVPVYWMATEDHDFDEINYFNFAGQKVKWNIETSGAVGRLETQGLDELFETWSSELGDSMNAQKLKTLFQKSYLEHDNLSEATRYLVNELFGEYGLVIVDGDDSELKRLLSSYVQKDIFENVSFNFVSDSISQLSGVSSKYKIQVNPREINYFYLKEGLRERIVEKDGIYTVNNTEIEFSREELGSELENHPERFSPNVIARPLYQEVILPNLCYVGGGGELAYWLELKSYFEELGVTFPMLLLRNSALLMAKKQKEKIEKLELHTADLFLKQQDLINKKVREISEINIDFSSQKKYLEEQFIALHELAKNTDSTFLGAVRAQEVKQKKGLDALEKRLLKAQKRKLNDHVHRMTDLQNSLFPNQSLQERHTNFSTLYLELGERLIPELIASLEPLQSCFSVLRY
ncbi:MAG: bacillithiol biosynthesis cysteine-adding enzyme BshC [Bacteroidota bacterium]